MIFMNFWWIYEFSWYTKGLNSIQAAVSTLFETRAWISIAASTDFIRDSTFYRTQNGQRRLNNRKYSHRWWCLCSRQGKVFSKLNIFGLIILRIFWLINWVRVYLMFWVLLNRPLVILDAFIPVVGTWKTCQTARVFCYKLEVCFS